MQTLSAHFHANAERIFEARRARHAEMTNPARVRAFQQELRAHAREILGPYVLSFDRHTPPRVQKAGELSTDGVTIEKLLYEMFPDFWVPALIYRPSGRIGHCPALVMPVGHWFEGKAAPMYQRLMRLLARRGVICASFDGCGQGERMIPFDPVIRDAMKALADSHPPGQAKPYPLAEAATHGFVFANNVTSTHCMLGDPGYLCGVHQHALTALAGKRLIDLLCSRADVNPKRIGACGASGGGTDTRYLAALDERLALIAPISIVGSDRSVSGGDADQSFFFSLERGFSQVDLLVCQAPKPLLLVSASEDKHDPAKVAAFYRPFWDAFGAGEALESGIGEGPHGFPPASRKLVVEFILKHLRDDARPIQPSEHPDDDPLPDRRELFCTPRGNVYYDGFGKNSFDLIRERTARLAKSRKTLAPTALRKAVLETLREPEGTFERAPQNLRHVDGAIIWESEGGVPVQLIPRGRGSRHCIVAHEAGSAAVFGSEFAASLEHAGAHLAALDVRGLGPSAAVHAEYNGAFLAPLLMGTQASLARLVMHQGRTLVGLRCADLLQAPAAWNTPSAKRPPDLLAVGGLGFSALFAAYLKPEAFGRIYLYQAPLSFRHLADSSKRYFNFAHFLYGVLERFDTPDLTKALPKGKLIWINPVDGSGRVVTTTEAHRVHRGGRVAFHHARTPAELSKLLTAKKRA